MRTSVIACAIALTLVDSTLRGDTFGSGSNTFTIDFVRVGNAGNGDDAGAGDGLYFSPFGQVPYEFRMGVHEIPQDAIDKAKAEGLVGVGEGEWMGDLPAGHITWYEAAAFVNWLNTSTGHAAAYNLNPAATFLTLWSAAEAWQIGGENLYRHKDAFYYLPSEDEWYKAAYHKNDGVTANYWDYATGSNDVPDGINFNGDVTFDAVFNQGYASPLPNVVTNVGISSPYGTLGQNGNVWEWLESASTPPNDSPFEDRSFRAGTWTGGEANLRSSVSNSIFPAVEIAGIGFRVASIPEPACAPLLLAGVSAIALRRRAGRRVPLACRQCEVGTRTTMSIVR